MQWPSISRAEDAAVLALADLAEAAAGISYRVIGGNMVTFHSARREVHLAPRSTDDADAGIESSAVTADALVSALLRSGYSRVDGSRFTRDEGELELVIDLLVSDAYADKHNIEIGSLCVDAAPGLSLALARDPMWVECIVVLTTGQPVALTLPLPEISVAVIMKTLAWASRYEDKDALDTFRLLDCWSQDVTAREAMPLGLGSTVTRALNVLEKNFQAPKGKALLLPKIFQKEGRRSVSQFISTQIAGPSGGVRGGVA